MPLGSPQLSELLFILFTATKIPMKHKKKNFQRNQVRFRNFSESFLHFSKNLLTDEKKFGKIYELSFERKNSGGNKKSDKRVDKFQVIC